MNEERAILLAINKQESIKDLSMKQKNQHSSNTKGKKKIIQHKLCNTDKSPQKPTWQSSNLCSHKNFKNTTSLSTLRLAMKAKPLHWNRCFQTQYQYQEQCRHTCSTLHKISFKINNIEGYGNIVLLLIGILIKNAIQQ